MKLEIEPAPDFAERVMAAVRREAFAPGPIPFPWRRIAATAAVAVGVSAISLAAVARTSIPAQISELGVAAVRMSPVHLAGAAAGGVLLVALIGITARLASR